MLEQLKSEHQKNPDCIETNRAIAEYYLNDGKEVEAEPYLVKVLELDEQIAQVHNQLGAVYYKISQYAKAEYHLKRALQLDFSLAEAHFNLAFLYQTQGEFEKALPYYKEVVNSNPGDAQVYCLMGQCAQCIEMLQEAEAFFAESFRLSPMSEAAMHLSTIYISEERYSEAEEVLDFLITMMDKKTALEQSEETSGEHDTEALDSTSGAWRVDKEYLQFTLGLVLKKQEKYIPAIKHLRDVVMMNDQYEEAFNYLGECCAAIEQNKEAESFFIHANKLDPQYLQPIMNLAKLNYHQERYHRAITVMGHYIKRIEEQEDAQDQATQKDQEPQTEFAHELLGLSYMQLGDKEKAIEIWKKSLEANPDQPRLISLIDGSHDQTYRKTTLSIDD